jgi:regulator of sirC expression with transglutaminase-like and TPR domain
MSQTRKSDPTPLSETRLAAMLVLLGDDDEAIASTIREQFLAAGEPALKWLEAHRLHDDPLIRRRVRQLLLGVAAREADNVFLGFCLRHGENFDLEDGVWAFNRTAVPSLNVEAYRAQLDDWAGRIREQVSPGGDGKRALETMNGVLYQDLGFRGNEKDYYDPANSYVNMVMDRRLGTPISMCAVYLFIAQRLRLPVAGIGMPGHFLCRYQTPTEEYYIDAFHGGRLLARSDCKKRLKELAVAYDESHLAPISARRILQRMVHNLYIIQKERKRRDEAERLQRYLIALAR